MKIILYTTHCPKCNILMTKLNNKQYIFKGGIVQERVQTGNAVPPLLIYNITKPIMEDICSRNKK